MYGQVLCVIFVSPINTQLLGGWAAALHCTAQGTESVPANLFFWQFPGMHISSCLACSCRADVRLSINVITF